MEEALRLLLTNAVLAGVLALAAWAVSRLTKRQAVVHGLWLLALLKLVTPPLVELPLLPATGDAAAATGRPAVAPEALLPAPGAPRRRAALAASAAAAGVAPRADRPAAAPPIDPRTAASRTSSGGESRAPAPADATATPGPRRASRAFRLALPALLALGALLVAGLATFRFLRFRRLAGEAEPAPPELAGRVAEIAEALGLRRVPSIALLPARAPPTLCRPRPGRGSSCRATSSPTSTPTSATRSSRTSSRTSAGGTTGSASSRSARPRFSGGTRSRGGAAAPCAAPRSGAATSGSSARCPARPGPTRAES